MDSTGFKTTIGKKKKKINYQYLPQEFMLILLDFYDNSSLKSSKYCTEWNVNFFETLPEAKLSLAIVVEEKMKDGKNNNQDALQTGNDSR